GADSAGGLAADVRQAQQDAVNSIVERANHGGDVHQGRSLDTSFTDRTRGISLEIDDHEVLAGEEQLPQVVIPVATDALARERGIEDTAEALQDLAFGRDDPLSQRASSEWDHRLLLRQSHAQPARQVAPRLVKRPLVELAEWRRREGRVVSRSEHEMQ